MCPAGLRNCTLPIIYMNVLVSISMQAMLLFETPVGLILRKFKVIVLGSPHVASNGSANTKNCAKSLGLAPSTIIGDVGTNPVPTLASHGSAASPLNHILVPDTKSSQLVITSNFISTLLLSSIDATPGKPS